MKVAQGGSFKGRHFTSEVILWVPSDLARASVARLAERASTSRYAASKMASTVVARRRNGIDPFWWTVCGLGNYVLLVTLSLSVS